MQFDAIQVHVGAVLRDIVFESRDLLQRGSKLVLNAPLLLLCVLQMVVHLLKGQLQVALDEAKQAEEYII